jgi:hypothetical protein
LWKQRPGAAIAKLANAAYEIAQARERIPDKSLRAPVIFVIARARRECSQ